MGSCKTCEEMQESSEGTAPVRTRYNQPTMYDHMTNYQQFKVVERQQNELLDTKEMLISESTKNTNIKWEENVDDILKRFSTQKLAQLRQGTQANKNLEELTVNLPDRGQSKSNESLVNISRSPVNCPVTSCTNTIGITSVLSHFLRDHQQKFYVDLQEITSGRRSVLMFDESIFTCYNENVCLGLLTYAGKTNDKEARPAILGLCRPNSFLPEKYSYLVNHLPLLILGCKTTLTCLLKDKELADKYHNIRSRNQEIIVIWLSTVETKKILHCTITAFNSEMTTSRSIITEVRNLKYPQEPYNFMPQESNFLMLTRGEIDLLSNNSRNEIQLEIFVHEYDEQ